MEKFTLKIVFKSVYIFKKLQCHVHIFFEDKNNCKLYYKTVYICVCVCVCTHTEN